MTIVLVVVLWCILALAATVRFSVAPVYSVHERARLVAAGHPAAKREDETLADQVMLASVYRVLIVLLVGLFAWCSLSSFGEVVGLLILVSGLILLPLACRLSWMIKLSDKLRSFMTPYLKKILKIFHPIFSALRERELPSGSPRLNSKDELMAFIKRSPGVLSGAELRRLEAGLAFDDKAVSDIMTPRSRISAVSEKETLGPLVIDELFKTGHSRFPVYKNDLDHIVGVLYLHELLDLKPGHKTAMTAMKSAVYYIHENDSLAKALHGFLSTKHHLFVVTNDQRETVGVLSLEDVMEVLLGQKIANGFDKFDDIDTADRHSRKGDNQPKRKKGI